MPKKKETRDRARSSEAFRKKEGQDSASLLSLLRKYSRQGMSFSQVFKALGWKSSKRNLLRNLLRKLEKEGIIINLKRRYFINPQMELLRGRFSSSGKGYGFLIVRGREGRDVFIPARYTKGAFDGDVVDAVVRIKGRKGRPEGKIIEIVQKSSSRLVGKYREVMGQGFLVPFVSASPEEVPVSSGKGLSPKQGEIISVDRDSLQIADVFGFPDEPGVDLKVVIQRFGLPSKFPSEVSQETEKIPLTVPSSEISKRKDFRNWLTVTIDGEKAQDFDDAVSIRPLKNGGFILGIHIADVSYYVRPGTSLDKEALNRGTSVYFSDWTIPMLPEKLSNNLCSLRPREDKLTLSILLEIDAGGQVIKADFHPSVIRTAERLTYTSVFKIFKGDRQEKEKYSPLVSDLLLMKDCACLLRQRRVEQGSLDFDLIEPELVYREGKLQAVAAFEVNEAHRLIEEFMVAANEAVAHFLFQKKYPFLYRIHPNPSLESLERLKRILAHFNLSLPPSKRIRSKDLQQVLGKVKNRPEEKFIQVQLLRSLKLAMYSDRNTGHYGLGKEFYAHFTSPIRRYPDLTVHRVLRKALLGRPEADRSLSELGFHCSERERNADEAEKNLLRWRIYRLLREKMGDEVEGMIVDINFDGLAVELKDYFVEGQVDFADLPENFPRRQKERLFARKYNRSYELGDLVRVIIASVDPFLQRMTLVMSQAKRR